MTMTASTFQLRRIRVADLHPSRDNIRGDLEDIDELAASVRTHGVMQPLVVNDEAGTLYVTDGHRRLEAARRAGVPVLTCLLTEDAPTASVLLTMLAAAMHRQLAPLDQARAFQRLHTDEGMSIADIATGTGHSPTFVRNRLLLLQLPPKAQDLVDEQAVTLTHAADLARQVKSTRTGSTRAGRHKSRWLTRTHPLAQAVQQQCTHRDERAVIGGAGCGQCWEQAIRDDQSRQLTVHLDTTTTEPASHNA